MEVSYRGFDDNSFFGRMILNVPEEVFMEYLNKLKTVHETMGDRTPGIYDVKVMVEGVDFTEYLEKAGWNLLERMAKHMDEESEKIAKRIDQLQNDEKAMDWEIKEKAEEIIKSRCGSLIDNLRNLQYDSWDIVNNDRTLPRRAFDDIKKLLDTIHVTHSEFPEFKNVEEHLKNAGLIEPDKSED